MSGFPFERGDVIRVFRERSEPPSPEHPLGKTRWGADKLGTLDRRRWDSTDVLVRVVDGRMRFLPRPPKPGEFYVVAGTQEMADGATVAFLSERRPTAATEIAVRRRMACPTGTG